MGAGFIDYIIADPIVLPFEEQPHYTENIVHLPDCYMVNDRKRTIASRTPTRGELDLPADGFVFCCFNNNWKITSAIFDIWMRLLTAVKGSVLWLFRDNGNAETNLRKEAAARGIDPLVSCLRTDCPSKITWRGTAWPICSWIRCPIMPTLRQAMRCGRGFRC